MVRSYLRQTFRQVLAVYWELCRIILPVSLFTELAYQHGLIAWIAPVFGPVMALFGLPPELAIAWITGMLVGVWAAIPVLFTVISAPDLSVGNITVFSALILFAHALPIEQKIIQRAGPGFVLTTFIRVLGGIIYAAALNQVLTWTGWLSQPASTLWAPDPEVSGWAGWMAGQFEMFAWMFAILLGLSIGLDALKKTGLMDLLLKVIAPLLSISGIKGEARQFAAIGLFLGISYGGGFLIAEARSGRIPRRQVFIACVFMGFAHSLIEDTLIVMAIGADFFAVFAGRVLFATFVTALIAKMLPDRMFGESRNKVEP